MQKFFESLKDDQNLLARAQDSCSGSGKDDREDRNLFLKLYYSTALDLDQIQNLSTAEAIQLLDWREGVSLPHISRCSLSNFIIKRAMKRKFLFNQALRSMDPADLKELIGSNLEIEVKQELKATRVLCSSSEYEILPTPLRLHADPRYTGKGVCIAFLDGGFYPHPDLMNPIRRVVAYKDLGDPNRPKSDFEKPDHMSWHGMQTCVSAAGNGYLSQGLYKGIASEANVALLKVGSEYGFTTEAIVDAITWCIRKQKRYNIRVINISLGVDGEGSFRESPINHAAEEAVQAGINVVVAVGNELMERVTPPGNSPSVITVGGLDDRNTLSKEEHGMYHSSYGMTADGIMKPELIAPGIWVAAPILPGTDTYRNAQFLWNLQRVSNKDRLGDQLSIAAEANDSTKDLARDILTLDERDRPARIRDLCSAYKLISPHYQHVDGTSFSAPIICSIIAQMLEANPDLDPKSVKEILMATAKRLDSIPVERQGCGVVQASEAVEMARRRISTNGIEYPRIEDETIHLVYENETSKKVEVLGSFNDWEKGSNPMKRDGDGVWKTKISLPSLGTYEYKFLVDGDRWVDDPLNTSKSYDGYGGFNSLVHIHGTHETRAQLKDIGERLGEIQSIKKEFLNHRLILKDFDKVLSHGNLARNSQLRNFYEKRMRKVLDDLKFRKVEQGVFLYQLYNSGYIIQTPTLNIGIDVVSGKHVWDVYWDVDPTVFARLSDLLDISFVTHRLPDHLDLDVVNRLISQDKIVVVPSGMESLCLNGVIGFEPGETRDLYSLGREQISLKIQAYDGVYRDLSANDIDLRCYRMAIEEKLRILHLGEHSYGGFSSVPGDPFFLGDAGHIDILICPLPRAEFEGEVTQFYQFIKRLNPDVIIPSHLAELGQSKAQSKEGPYEKAYEILEKTGKDFAVLTWGDSVKIGHI